MSTIYEVTGPSRVSVSRKAERSDTPETSSRSEKNIGKTERQVSIVAGAVLGVLGIVRRDLPGLALAGVGASLVYRGATGYCGCYDALGISTADKDGDAGDTQREAAVNVVETFLIAKPAQELYSFWRDFENLPRFMTHLKSVKKIDARRSRWVVDAPAIVGGTVEWEAEIVDDKLNSHISWHSLPDAEVGNRGTIEFKPAPGNRGTAVRVELEYSPPAGRLGRWAAKLLGSEPESLIREDLRNFKRLMEVGEIVTTDGQPRGSCAAGLGRWMK